MTTRLRATALLCVLLSLTAGHVSAQQCPPVDLIQVIDRSGSMSGPLLGVSKQAADGLVVRLDAGSDRTALASFNTSANLDSPLTGAFAGVRAAIAGLTAGGGTDVAAGIARGQDELRANATARPVLVLYSDGFSEEQAMLREAATAKLEGTTVFVIAFSHYLSDYNLAVLRAVASSPEHMFEVQVEDDLLALMDLIRDSICVCGDGVLDPPLEQCDDGNAQDGDGCSGCVLDPVCGDGLISAWETCDEGSTCEDGSACVLDGECAGIGDQLCRHRGSDICGEDCNWNEPFCGNGRVELGEACDDGNSDSNDGCDILCRITPICGNGVFEPYELCEDGNLDPGDGCDENCRPECIDPDGGAVLALAATTLFGVTQAPDSCLDGTRLEEWYCGHDCNQMPGDTPTPIALRSQVFDCVAWGYAGGCAAGACVPDDGERDPLPDCSIFCGDGVVEPGEDCDDGNLEDGDGCSSACTLETSCGDGVLDHFEQCDDGNNVDGDGCSAFCRLEGCGDGVQQDWEDCDDGNLEDGDGCSQECVLETICGDGNLDGLELCDDGNSSPADLCDEHCLPTRCGDGVVQTPNGAGTGGPAGNGVEECDDGNQVADDGCTDCELDEPLSVSWTSLEVACANGERWLSWSVADELGTVGYQVERARQAGGPWRLLAGMVWATGSWSQYDWRDGEAAADTSYWYRVREVCSQASCDLSPRVRSAACVQRGSGLRRRAP